MSMYAVETRESTPERFEAGLYPIAHDTIVASADIKAHAPVKIAAGKAAPVAAADIVDGTIAGLYGLAEADAATGEPVPVALTGQFFADALALESGVIADALKVPLRNIGIFLE